MTTCLVPLLEQGGGCAFSSDLAWALCKDVFLAKESSGGSFSPSPAGGSGQSHSQSGPTPSSAEATAALRASWQRCWDLLLRLGWICSTHISTTNNTNIPLGGPTTTDSSSGAPASSFSSLLALSSKMANANSPIPPYSSSSALSSHGTTPTSTSTTMTVTIASLAAITSHPMSVEDGCPVAVDRVRQYETYFLYMADQAAKLNNRSVNQSDDFSVSQSNDDDSADSPLMSC